MKNISVKRNEWKIIIKDLSGQILSKEKQTIETEVCGETWVERFVSDFISYAFHSWAINFQQSLAWLEYHF